MRRAGRLAASILDALSEKIKPGVSTLALNDYANELTEKAGAKSAPFGYRFFPTDPPFPKHICTSINNVVCHGIPAANAYLKKGDIINCDVTVILDGFHGDTSRTFFVGKVKPEIAQLVKVAQDAMMAGIAAIQPFKCVSVIGAAIEDYVKPYGYGIVKPMSGHGVGKAFHELPAVYHYRHPNYRQILKPGMTLTVEPMLNLKSDEVVLLNDGWTVVTKDGSWSAQWEHTVAITENGPEILTVSP